MSSSRADDWKMDGKRGISPRRKGDETLYSSDPGFPLFFSISPFFGWEDLFLTSFLLWWEEKTYM